MIGPGCYRLILTARCGDFGVIRFLRVTINVIPIT